jgi:hypothetical protein
VVAGLLVLALERAGLPPWLRPGHLPGDLAWRGRSGQVFVPLGTCLVLSLLLSLAAWVVGKLGR